MIYSEEHSVWMAPVLRISNLKVWWSHGCSFSQCSLTSEWSQRGSLVEDLQRGDFSLTLLTFIQWSGSLRQSKGIMALERAKSVRTRNSVHSTLVTKVEGSCEWAKAINGWHGIRAHGSGTAQLQCTDAFNGSSIS